MKLPEREEKQRQFEEEMEDRFYEETQKKLLKMIEASGLNPNDPAYSNFIEGALKELGLDRYDATITGSQVTMRKRNADGSYTPIVRSGSPEGENADIDHKHYCPGCRDQWECSSSECSYSDFRSSGGGRVYGYKFCDKHSRASDQ